MDNVYTDIVGIVQTCLCDWGSKESIRMLAGRTGCNIMDQLFELEIIKEFCKDSEILIDDESKKYIIDTHFEFVPSEQDPKWPKFIKFADWNYEHKIILPVEILNVLKNNFDTWKGTELEDSIEVMHNELLWQLNELYRTLTTGQNSNYVIDSCRYLYRFTLKKEYIKE
mgnify:FL=1